MNTLLSPYRVLDLTDHTAFICGRILADLGADVIKIEPPGGDPSRRTGPFYHDIPDPQKSLYWFAYNANKRGVTLDLESADGREIFRKLAVKSHFVIESFAPGHMDKLGLGYSELSRLDPGIIVVSISPFGQRGPYADFKTSDIVAQAMGGIMYITGDEGRPPVRMGADQSFANAGAQGAVGAMTAHYYRASTGRGQHVDVSIQESVVRTLLNALNQWQLRRVNVHRQAPYRIITALAKQRLMWECQDGYISYSVWGGALGARSNQELVDWMDSEGMAPDFLKAIDWSKFDMAKVTQEDLDRMSEPMMAFFKKHTVGYVYEYALKKKIMLYPVQTMKDVVDDQQLRSRSFWADVEHPELGARITYPGAFATLKQNPLSLRRRAPLIGEHNIEIYEGDLGYSRDELTLWKQSGVI